MEPGKGLAGHPLAAQQATSDLPEGVVKGTDLLLHGTLSGSPIQRNPNPNLDGSTEDKRT